MEGRAPSRPQQSNALFSRKKAQNSQNLQDVTSYAGKTEHMLRRYLVRKPRRQKQGLLIRRF